MATIKTGNAETAAVALPEGTLPITEINASQDADWPTDLFYLLESGGTHDFQSWFRGLDGAAVEDLRGRTNSRNRVEYAPLYRRPRKIWGIGLNYAEHAGDLSESAPADEPASFMRPDTTIIGPGDEIVLPARSQRVTGEAELAAALYPTVEGGFRHAHRAGQVGEPPFMGA